MAWTQRYSLLIGHVKMSNLVLKFWSKSIISITLILTCFYIYIRNLQNSTKMHYSF